MNDTYTTDVGGVVTAGAAAPPTPGPAPAPAPMGTYRTEQYHLFQGVDIPVRPSRLGPGGGLDVTKYWLPTNKYVDITAGWKWQNPGGDWVDANGVPQGTVPLSTFVANKASGSTAVFTYDVDITAALNAAFDANKPAAFIMRRVSGNAPRSFAGLFGSYDKPLVEVQYEDGTSALLNTRVIASNTTSSTDPTVKGNGLPLSIFIEFDRPTKRVASATVPITATQHWSGTTPTIGFFLLDPRHEEVVDETGDFAVYEAGNMDAGLADVEGIIGVHRYLDGSNTTDFFDFSNINFFNEDSFSPEFWDPAAAPVLSRLPYRAAGKFINATANIEFVPSTYEGHGFKPLMPGLGAIKTRMPDEGRPDGGEKGNRGTDATNCLLYLPPDKMGLCDDLYIRQYVRVSNQYAPTAADRREYWNGSDGSRAWTSFGGKFGVTPVHPNYYDGVQHNSAGAGGNKGSQMRLTWKMCDETNGGGQHRGIALGYHLYDFGGQQPAPFRYGAEAQDANQFGSIGGRGACIYPVDHWYCIETRMKYNSVNLEHPDFPGKFFSEDGILQTWIDGRLVYDRQGMVFRHLPRWSPVRSGTKLRPMRDLGHVALWWNWFNGGLELMSYEMYIFMTGLAWGERRIGPMQGVV
jgi:hypothetical protein